ncbi:mammalian cell entry protein [Mycobacterium sp. UM_CSW]|uniref:mammalian cell entry protein n=1 Tax=Mycobacterium sp. UM_CSW TaxID=1370119 RepID=UPI0003FBCE5E|nr:mammalian cell entry protein [Mycobacterium sp. UM_CSW]
MEDQQPDTGDLTAAAATTDEPTNEDVEATAVEATAVEPDAEPDESAEPATESAASEGEEAAETKPARRPRRKILAGKRLAITIAVAALLFVGSAAFAGAAVQPYLTDRATAATKLKVARTAANAITTLWTYTPENMDGLADRAAAYLSGDFEAQYRKFVDAIVGPNKQAKVTNSTEVTGAAVESLDDPNAVVIVYTNTTSTSPLTKNIPSLKYLSYRLFMKRTNGHWLVTRMTTITSLDLTPHV